MYVVYVPINMSFKPIAWFEEKARAMAYADFLRTSSPGEFSEVKYEGEVYVEGDYYERP